MAHILVEVSGATDPTRTLVFVRGFQGLNRLLRKPTHSTKWYRALRSWGYDGHIITFRWHSPRFDCVSQIGKRLAPIGRDLFAQDVMARVDEAAEALCDLLGESAEFDPARTSVMGFSMGGWIIARALRIARRHGTKVRRAYLFGAAAPRKSRWPELFDAISDRAWNFYSPYDMTLRMFASGSVGLLGLPCYHPKARDVDCTTLISRHDDWRINVIECLSRARLRPEML